MTAKVVRTPREWTEECRECRGSGHVKKREHFALWTPDEYEHVQPLDGQSGAGAVCTAAPGASIFEACKEGVEVARLAGRPVAFEFNGAVAVVTTDSDPATVAKEWWKRAYGKTYEQSLAER